MWVNHMAGSGGSGEAYREKQCWMGLLNTFTALTYTSHFRFTPDFGKVTDFLEIAHTHRLMGQPLTVVWVQVSLFI